MRSIDNDRKDSRTLDHVLNGTIDAQGEDANDRWRLIVTNNVVTTQEAKVVWE